MKSTKVVKIISFIFLVIVCFFGPAFIIGNDINSLLFALIFKGFDIYSFLLLFGFLCFIFCFFLTLFIRKNNIVNASNILLSIGSVLIFSFSSEFMSKNKGISFTLYFISLFIILISCLILLNALSNLFLNNKLTVGDIVEIGIFVSLAVVLDLGFFKIKITTNGGSISLAMLPLFLLSLRKGFLKGFVASGIIFGLITCLTDNYGFITFPFDYLFGFGSLAIIGLFRKMIISEDGKIHVKGILFLTIGFCLSIFARLSFATLSGILIYKLDFVGSLVYQLTYLGPSSGIVFAVLVVLYKPLLLIEKRYSYANK